MSKSKHKHQSMISNDNKGIIQATQNPAQSQTNKGVNGLLKSEQTYPKNKSKIDTLYLHFNCSNGTECLALIDVLKPWFRKMNITSIAGGKASKQWPDSILLKTPHALSQELNTCGSIKLNPELHTIKVHLSGQGCEVLARFEDAFVQLVTWGQQLNGKLMGVHIALDDQSGKYNLDWVTKAFGRKNYFPKSGPRPEKGILKNKEGKSFQIGKDNSPKNILIYEKGKQLNLPTSDPLYKNWTRHEVRFKNIKRQPLPLDMLTQPDGYFVGAYKANKALLKGVEPLSIEQVAINKTAKSICDKVLYAKRQCGKTLGTLVHIGFSPENILKATARIPRQRIPMSEEYKSNLRYMTERFINAEQHASHKQGAC
ncbi:replication initiation factor domain-containing protein [Pseudoalteromonas tunicata]|uniref:replication initiation factor domain-containing protein n=1 Tax=Pseudoalteromonas tunicata TaxID=314281 RepID=UPI00273D5069|nr:replication initiation factor domain-containing protein [Pseudoalteromonas tunicata]MDP4984431.1 replication initiation factor domain-containing protein [Pseudoalteromonas tunicata]